ncbi:MAG: amidohydrolase family protein [Planctomycetaceae bacterium]
MKKENLLPGLPTGARLRGFRIWDSYFTPAFAHPGSDGSDKLLADFERSRPAIETFKVERLCYFSHVGIGTTTDAAFESFASQHAEALLKPLSIHGDLLIMMIQLNANNVAASLDAMKRWLRDGPAKGVYFAGGGPGARTCTDAGCRELIEAAIDLEAVIMQHTWFKTGGKQGPGESTPAELATVASHYPRQKFICAHAGGEWEQGLRAIRDAPNVLAETSGFDATAGFIEMAVREIGADRIVFGSHLPGRSLGTELGKVLGADISDADRFRILGENFRQLLEA